MSCSRVYMEPKKCFNQLRVTIVVEKIQKISKIGTEMAEIEHFHYENVRSQMRFEISDEI